MIKIASSVEETINERQIRVEEALNHIDSNRLIAAPDCGLGLLNRKLAIDKMKNLCKAAHSI